MHTRHTRAHHTWLPCTIHNRFTPTLRLCVQRTLLAKSKQGAGWFTQLRFLMWRSGSVMVRNKIGRSAWRAHTHMTHTPLPNQQAHLSPALWCLVLINAYKAHGTRSTETASLCLRVRPSVRPSVNLSACLSVCLSVIFCVCAYVVCSRGPGPTHHLRPPLRGHLVAAQHWAGRDHRQVRACTHTQYTRNDTEFVWMYGTWKCDRRLKNVC